MSTELGARSRAILIGTATYPSDETLHALPAARTNVLDLMTVLCDSEIVGMPQDAMIELLDEEHASVVETKLARAARAAMDTLLVYYAGHGIVGEEQNELVLAVRGTTQQEGLYNGISVEKVRRAIRDSPAKRKILIVDCCFSGRIVEFMSGDSTAFVQGQLQVNGTYAIASAPANKPAIARSGERNTAFTGAFLGILKAGLDNGKDVLTLDEVYSATRSRLVAQDLPEPQRVTQKELGSWPFAKNLYYKVNADHKLAELTAQLSAQDAALAALRQEVDVLAQSVRAAPTASGPAQASAVPANLLQFRSLAPSLWMWGVLIGPAVLSLYMALNLDSDQEYRAAIRLSLLSIGLNAIGALLGALTHFPRLRRMLGPTFPSGGRLILASALGAAISLFSYTTLL